MIGATAKSEQFHSRTGNESTKGSRKGFDLLGGGVDVASVLTPKEKRDCLKTRLRWLMALKATTILTRKELNELRDIQLELRRTRTEAKPKRLTTLSNHFVDICRETMPMLQFERLIRQARARAESELNNSTGEQA